MSTLDLYMGEILQIQTCRRPACLAGAVLKPALGRSRTAALFFELLHNIAESLCFGAFHMLRLGLCDIL